MIPSVNIPEGTSGVWSIKHVTVSPEAAAFERIRAVVTRQPGVPEGTYTQLLHGNTLVMSDTPSEKSDHWGIMRSAHGHVLVTGLGIAMITNALASKDSVDYITVVEKSSDVIKLVVDTISSKKVRVIHADALRWKPRRGMRFDWAWHDIWTYICSDNKVEMSKLRRHYGPRMTAAKRQLCWCEGEWRW